MKYLKMKLLVIVCALSIMTCWTPLKAQALNIIELAHTDSHNESFTVTLGDGYAYWSHTNEGLYMWETSSSMLVGHKIADDEDAYSLTASGNKLAWIHENDIELWDGQSSQEVEDDVVDTVSLYGNNIAFVEEDTEDFFHPDTEIFVRISGKKKQISDNDYIDKDPSIYQETVAWVGEHDDNYDLFYWDGSNEYKLTDTDGDDRHPSLDNAAIAWTEWDGDDWEIFYWAGQNNIQITDDDDDEDDKKPVLKNGKIVWVKEDGSCSDIYSWDGSGITKVTDECYDKIDSLDFNGHAILWSAETDRGKSVYYAELPGSSRALTGWWYDAAEPGTGLATQVEDNNIFLAWFVYDSQGRTTWYSAYGEISNGSSFSGDLYSWTGWSWGSAYYPPSASIVGTIVLNFNHDNDTYSVTFSASMNGKVVTKTFTSFMEDFAPGQEDSRHLTGWWYDPAYNGMGFFLDARGGKMALAWYNYRDDNTASWFTSYNIFPDNSASYIGNLDGWTGGPCATCPYNGAPVMNPGAGGSIKITFSDSNHAVAQIGDTTVHLERFPLD